MERKDTRPRFADHLSLQVWATAKNQLPDRSIQTALIGGTAAAVAYASAKLLSAD